MRVLISADSTCDLNEALLEENHIAVTPLYVFFGEEERKDGVECGSEDIFAYTARTGKLCSTAAVSIADYEAFFTEQLRRFDAIVHFTISAECSSCFQNALAAAVPCEGRVLVVDSRSVSSGIGLQVLRAAADRDAGLRAEEIYERAMERRERVKIYGVFETVEYMHKGGRCSGVAALGANLLKIKPGIEPVDGRLTMGKKYRGTMQKVIREFLADKLAQSIRTDLCLVPNSLQSEELLCLAMDEIAALRSFERIAGCPLGATVSCHCGPNTMAIAFELEE